MTRSIKGVFAAAALALVVGACGYNPLTTASWGTRHSLSERECMARAMYFESNRSSDDGMVAVGTVVMNRLQSGRYPKTVCGVVGQHNQFAQGALSNPVSGRSWALALAKADDVLAGQRHGRVAGAMHFHTAGYTFPYRNMAYVVAAGGNVFYEKRTPGTFPPIHPTVLVAQAGRERSRPSDAIVLARADEPVPIVRRAGPTRLAAVEDREAPREMRVPTPRSSGLRREVEANDTPRIRAKPERIRLAHLDDSDLPKALRQRADAAPQGPLGGISLSYKPKFQQSQSKTASHTRPDIAKLSSAKIAISGSAKAEALKPSAARASQGRLPPGPAPVTRDAKAKPATASDPAKLGWKRGADAVALANKTKAR